MRPLYAAYTLFALTGSTGPGYTQPKLFTPPPIEDRLAAGLDRVSALESDVARIKDYLRLPERLSSASVSNTGDSGCDCPGCNCRGKTQPAVSYSPAAVNPPPVQAVTYPTAVAYPATNWMYPPVTTTTGSTVTWGVPVTSVSYGTSYGTSYGATSVRVRESTRGGLFGRRATASTCRTVNGVTYCD